VFRTVWRLARILMDSPREATRPDGTPVFFLYATQDDRFIVETRVVHRASMHTYSLVAFWPREDHAQGFDSRGAVGSTAERYVRECFEGSPEALASLIDSGSLRPLMTLCRSKGTDATHLVAPDQ